MVTNTAVLERPHRLSSGVASRQHALARLSAHAPVNPNSQSASLTLSALASTHKEPLLREALGTALRAFRSDRGVTLRELAELSSVSPGYLSELERGRKEVSSEVLASVCHALETSVADVLIEAAGSMAATSIDADLALTR